MVDLASQQANISQEYFDEVCLENHVDFELSEEDAVQETIQQLQSSLGAGKTLPSYLILNFPTSEEGIKERQVNQVLKSCIQKIRSCVENTTDESSDVAVAIQTLVETIQTNKAEQVSRFVVLGGFEALIDLWRQRAEGRNESLYTLLLDVFATEQSTRRNNGGTVLSLQELQKSFLLLWPVWLSTLEDEVVLSDQVENWNVPRLNQLLRLAIFAVKLSEPNKKALMAAKSTKSNKSTTVLLLEIVDVLNTTTTTIDMELHHQLVGSQICRLIATLCTYDDFRIAEGAPTVSSAHANVQAFQQHNAVVRIARYLQEKKETSAILALRAMAIHDDIVQTMVAVGLLDTASELLERLPSKDICDCDSNVNLEALTAVIGLFRNVCANDEIKSRLCVGEKSIVPGIALAMDQYPDAAKLQEHGCATFAAMALRIPKNAEYLVRQCDAATWIIRAMQKHPSRPTVQRQGALALRNLVSRSSELRPVVLQAGAAEVLKDIAAKHVSAQDEVYAALRDLGLPASMLRVEQDSNGQLVMKETEMFGQRQSAFRPVFD